MRKILAESQFKRDIKKQFLELITPAWAEVLHCLCNDILCLKNIVIMVLQVNGMVLEIVM
jgi:mRNA-degrading endonuclease YafQ of YafQ-DinJ toxin-antitoxin module